MTQQQTIKELINHLEQQQQQIKELQDAVKTLTQTVQQLIEVTKPTHILKRFESVIQHWYIPDSKTNTLNLVIQNAETQQQILKKLNSPAMTDKTQTKYFASPMIFTSSPQN
ncbi:hypothetical protein FDP41_001139 [Naegleria fowleri]|uniref:Uncharacterized protein n=1 Tax=Naegleria fowleri TaxID=5763 RepID=A0A6A5BXA9_NAEFO|nr:uncharacterized protein FDP41_001139 [Naegleria fowleri]KAF0979986.1 hypothetical protein FDP41_001139 [Naegleria fowleri]